MVININSPMIKPKNFNKIIIDTNILIDVFYSNIGKEISNRERNYQNFLSNCINTHIPLFTSKYNIFEALHVIDNINCGLYERKTCKEINLKEYHKINEERIKVREDFKIFYNSIKKPIKILDYSLKENELEEYFEDVDNTYDLYDFILIKTAQHYNFKYLLTHDSDFYKNIENMIILTQNSNLINNS